MKNVNLFLSLVLLLLGTVVAGLLYSLFYSETISEEETAGFCGVSSTFKRGLIENDSINYSVGKITFGNLCASCHNKNMKDNMTGPALSGVIARFKNDTLAFGEYVKNSCQYLLSHKDERLHALHAEYEGIIHPNYPMLSSNEIKSLVVFIEARKY